MVMVVVARAKEEEARVMVAMVVAATAMAEAERAMVAAVMAVGGAGVVVAAAMAEAAMAKVAATAVRMWRRMARARRPPRSLIRAPCASASRTAHCSHRRS